MLKQNKTNNANSSLSEDNPRIWKLAIPPQVKVFWWRVMHNFVLVKANLMERERKSRYMS
jgi:hypothetical protein